MSCGTAVACMCYDALSVVVMGQTETNVTNFFCPEGLCDTKAGVATMTWMFRKTDWHHTPAATLGDCLTVDVVLPNLNKYVHGWDSVEACVFDRGGSQR